MIVKVCVDTKTSAVDKIFEYSTPPHLEEEVKAGVRCSVPFGNGNKRRVGFVLSVSNATGSEWYVELLPAWIAAFNSV